MTIYDDLRRDHPLLAAHFDGSESRGNASHDRPFAPTLKASWIADMREELADALVYLRAEVALIGDTKRQNEEALLKWQELREIERRLVVTLKQLETIDAPWPTERVGLVESWSA